MATLSSNQAPTANEYGGDEVQALVLDAGYSSIRAGFAGEDVPKSILSSYYGKCDDGRFIFGDNSINVPRAGMEINNALSKDGIVEDWDTATKLWEYSITSRLTTPKQRSIFKSDNAASEADADGEKKDDEDKMALDDATVEGKLLEENPLLVTEPGWNPQKNREKITEIALESWGAPAFWLARNGVTSAFAAGKPSALVIDVGAANTSVCAIHDGILLKKSLQHTPLAGDFITQQCRLMLSQGEKPVTLNPYYTIKTKTAVEALSPSQATFRTFPAESKPTSSFHTFQENNLLHEFKESVVQVWPGPASLLGNVAQGPLNEEIARSQPGRPFEFPDGYNDAYTAPRYKVAESLFDARAGYSSDSVPAPTPAQTLPAIIKACLEQVDVDIRSNLLANVVVCGGSSLIQGFTERLHQELQTMYPGGRVRISAPGNIYERRFSSWIGGSILASLGTFHQMWISKAEYDEHGAGIVEKRCR